jgi:hypothetical protein
VMCGWEEVRTPEGDRLYRSTATGLLSSRHPCAPRVPALPPAHPLTCARARAYVRALLRALRKLPRRVPPPDVTLEGAQDDILRG